MFINFSIITPEKVVYKNEIRQATLPVKGGEVTILPNHIPYIGSLQAGEILLKGIKSKNKDNHVKSDAASDHVATVSLAVSSGFVEFSENKLVVLADTAERAEEIDEKKAEEAKRRAEELKKKKVTMGEMEFARVAAAIEREAARLKVARRYKRKKGIRT